MEDWNAIAAEVEGALREVADTSQPDGFPVTLRKVVVTGGVPWDPGSGTATPTYTGFVGFETVQEVRDASGTLIGQTRRTITVNATAGVVPSDDDQVALGVEAGEASESSPWVGILAVRPLSPVGTAVLYEIDLVT